MQADAGLAAFLLEVRQVVQAQLRAELPRECLPVEVRSSSVGRGAAAAGAGQGQLAFDSLLDPAMLVGAVENRDPEPVLASSRGPAAADLVVEVQEVPGCLHVPPDQAAQRRIPQILKAQPPAGVQVPADFQIVVGLRERQQLVDQQGEVFGRSALGEVHPQELL